MREQGCGNYWDCFSQAQRNCRDIRGATAAAVMVICFRFAALPTGDLFAAGNPSDASVPLATSAAETISLAQSLGVHFVQGSSSTLLLERNGRTYLVDLNDQTIREKASPSPLPAASLPHLESAQPSPPDSGSGAKIFADYCAKCHGTAGLGRDGLETPDFTNPAVQTELTSEKVRKIILEGKPGTAMPAWGGKLSDSEVDAVAAFVKSLGPASKSGVAAPAMQQETRRREPTCLLTTTFSACPRAASWTATVSILISLIASLIPPRSVEPEAAIPWAGSMILPLLPLGSALELPTSFRSAPTARPASLIDRSS